MTDRRGSITIDDEGTSSARNVLIENGILKGYMQDRQNACPMGVAATGNGRRESYAHLPMPRMTNTFMENGAYDPQEIVSSMKKGLYAVNFGGGQVDITSGNCVFCPKPIWWKMGDWHLSKGLPLLAAGRMRCQNHHDRQ